MPEDVKRVVGSFWGTRGALGILLCPLFSKKSMYLLTISVAVIVMKLYHEAKNYVIMRWMVERKIDKEIPRNIKKIGVLAGLAASQATLDFLSAIDTLSRKYIVQRFTSGYIPMTVEFFREVPFKMKNGSFVFPVEPNPNLLATAKTLGEQCDFWVMVANAPHIFRESLEKTSGKKFLSMIDVTIEEIKRRKLKKVGIIAIGLALKDRLFQTPLDALKIKYEVIPDDLVNNIDQSVFKVMEGEDPTRLKKPAIDAVRYLRKKGIDGIILGCTEVPLLLGDKAGEKDLINPSQLLAEAAVKLAISK